MYLDGVNIINDKVANINKVLLYYYIIFGGKAKCNIYLKLVYNIYIYIFLPDDCGEDLASVLQTDEVRGSHCHSSCNDIRSIVVQLSILIERLSLIEIKKPDSQILYQLMPIRRVSINQVRGGGGN